MHKGEAKERERTKERAKMVAEKAKERSRPLLLQTVATFVFLTIAWQDARIQIAAELMCAEPGDVMELILLRSALLLRLLWQALDLVSTGWRLGAPSCELLLYIFLYIFLNCRFLQQRQFTAWFVMNKILRHPKLCTIHFLLFNRNPFWFQFYTCSQANIGNPIWEIN
jgi:hypothetical protein